MVLLAPSTAGYCNPEENSDEPLTFPSTGSAHSEELKLRTPFWEMFSLVGGGAEFHGKKKYLCKRKPETEKSSTFTENDGSTNPAIFTPTGQRTDLRLTG